MQLPVHSCWEAVWRSEDEECLVKCLYYVTEYRVCVIGTLLALERQKGFLIVCNIRFVRYREHNCRAVDRQLLLILCRNSCWLLWESHAQWHTQHAHNDTHNSRTMIAQHAHNDTHNTRTMTSTTHAQWHTQHMHNDTQHTHNDTHNMRTPTRWPESKAFFDVKRSLHISNNIPNKFI